MACEICGTTRIWSFPDNDGVWCCTECSENRKKGEQSKDARIAELEAENARLFCILERANSVIYPTSKGFKIQYAGNLQQWALYRHMVTDWSDPISYHDTLREAVHHAWAWEKDDNPKGPQP